MEDKKLYSTHEAAEALGVTDSALRNLIMRGKFTPQQRVGRAWVFTRQEIEELRNRTKGKGGRPPKK